MRGFAMAVAAALLLALPARADEGMWLFTDPPLDLIESRYGFRPSPEWLLNLQRSAVRFNSGGSGSFVSADGLVMTNHHVGADSIHKLSTSGRDLLEEGFLARTRAEELRVPDLELNVLVSVEDVTQRVQASVEGLEGAAAEQARRAEMNEIEQESFRKTGLRSDVVTLYRGAEYHLYRSRRYTDVRLVFAPEQSIAFFGGDPDNFEFPRYDLDVTFFRAYEDGRPARVEHHLPFSREGASEGDLVFVAGHPGRTNRLDTLAHLEYLRDVEYPLRLDLIRRREVNLAAWSARSPENARRAQDELFSYQNGRKARLGALAGLQDPELVERKRQAEEALRARVGTDARYASAWSEVERTLEVEREILVPYRLLELGQAFDSRLFEIARTLLRLSEETAKPNARRLREYSESNLESVRLDLFSPAPIYADLEVVKLADSLSYMLEKLGPDDPLAQRVLAGRSPRRAAEELVKGSHLADVALRRRLAEGGVAASQDPMLLLARLVEGPARAVRSQYEAQVDEPRQQAYGRIARAMQQFGGQDVYPDATFTLRLAFGQVKGLEGVPWRTTLGGTFDHAEAHGSLPPFQLPGSWLAARPRLVADTPFNVISTVDIIGGNSGSPVVNRKGEVVGLIFDGNLGSLVWDLQYTDRVGRSLHVDTRAILEALKTIYGAEGLLGEISS